MVLRGRLCFGFCFSIESDNKGTFNLGLVFSGRYSNEFRFQPKLRMHLGTEFEIYEFVLVDCRLCLLCMFLCYVALASKCLWSFQV